MITDVLSQGVIYRFSGFVKSVAQTVQKFFMSVVIHWHQVGDWVLETVVVIVIIVVCGWGNGHNCG